MDDPNKRLLFPTVESMAACTDLYELTMAAGYFTHGMRQRAVFEYAIRRAPRRRSYLVFAGLEQALGFLENARFSNETIRFLRAQPAFARVPRAFFDYLRGFRFTGDLWAAPEGSLAFAGEPLLRVCAPIIEAQIVETFLLTMLNFQTAIASKAARVVDAARNHPVSDFGSRRAHGPQAGLLAARASFIAGCQSTSNILAGQWLGIPVVGTQAHSWVMAFPTEREAFRRYARTFPQSTILLIDTYDTIRGARHAAEIGRRCRAVRLDSGNLPRLCKEVRHVLDQAGLESVRILLSGDLDEYRIEDILRAHTPVDFFGVGTEMATSRDDPAIAGVYKMVAIEREGALRPVVKLSPGKGTAPYAKQVRRVTDHTGKFRRDIVCLADEQGLRGDPLLEPVMRAGKRIGPRPALTAIRQRCLGQICRLPMPMRSPRCGDIYPVLPSPALQKAARAARQNARREEALSERPEQ